MILGIETATRIGSVAVLSCPAGPRARVGEGADVRVLAEVTRDAGLRHGAELLSLLDECLEQAAVALEEVGPIAVSIGPGSFTGLRVGLATAKGLALAGGGALIGVPTLEALAATLCAGRREGAVEGGMPLGPGDLICPCLDARKGEVYAALFAAAPGEAAAPPLRLESDRALSPEALAVSLEARLGAPGPGDRPWRRLVLLGDGAERHREILGERLGAGAIVLPMARRPPSAGAVAELGLDELWRRGADDLAALVPAYARASQAEVSRALGAGGSEGAPR